MTIKFICYPKCSTCRDTKKYLEEKGLTLDYQDIKQDPPTVEELKVIHELSGLPIKSLFNTSGNSYRALNLKETFDSYSNEELYSLLSKDGMLIKRPIIQSKDKVIIGFKKEQIDEAF